MTDADIPLQPMTEYEQFLFDIKGFLVIPGVLSTAEIQTVRDHLDAYTQNPDGLPEPHHAPIAGPAEFLIDHPRAMGILQTVIDPDRERIRLESVFVSRRGIDEKEPWRPHVGGANVLPSFSYRYQNGRIYGGMTRIVWELNEVVKGKGGTCMVPGSHKANTVSAHAGTWPEQADHPDHGRSAILIAYNHVTVRHHEPKPCMNPAVIGGLSAKRQGFFRDVWILGNKR